VDWKETRPLYSILGVLESCGACCLPATRRCTRVFSLVVSPCTDGPGGVASVRNGLRYWSMVDEENRLVGLIVGSQGVGVLGSGFVSEISHLQYLSLPPATGSLGGSSIVRVCSTGKEAKSKQDGGDCGRWYLYGDGPMAEPYWTGPRLCWLVD
jgi:hypothetical protein